MPQAALNALLAAYRDQADWLDLQATEFETGRRILMTGQTVPQQDLSVEAAIEYRHKAGNLRAIITAYERLQSVVTK